jgi:hypothetical protein
MKKQAKGILIKENRKDKAELKLGYPGTVGGLIRLECRI